MNYTIENGQDRREVTIPAGPQWLRGTLTLPADASAVIVFAHGSGSGRLSPRNRHVAEVLHAANLGTLLIDLLDESEEDNRDFVFDISLLAERLQSTVDWLDHEYMERRFALGYFGASTGAGAALVAAARRPDRLGAVVSRGGRPDLARDLLGFVQAPTLLVVGDRDQVVLELNRDALDRLGCTKRLSIVRGASHLFSEPGTLDEVAHLAASWFTNHLAS